MIRFQPHDVEPERWIDDDERGYTTVAKLGGFEGASDERVIKPRHNPLVEAVGVAYNRHVPLTLSPDVIWLAIAQAFASHINKYPEELRERFVQHEGKEHIEIRRDTFIKGSPDNDWPGTFAEFSERIRDRTTPKTAELIIGDFSTTTPSSPP